MPRATWHQDEPEADYFHVGFAPLPTQLRGMTAHFLSIDPIDGAFTRTRYSVVGFVTRHCQTIDGHVAKDRHETVPAVYEPDEHSVLAIREVENSYCVLLDVTMTPDEELPDVMIEDTKNELLDNLKPLKRRAS